MRAKGNAGHARVALFAFMLALAIAPGCEENGTCSPDAGDAAITEDAGPPDTRPRDAAPDAGHDASHDATFDASVIQHYFCNEPFFKLPIDGQTEYTR
jgi:hypothetical protein